MGLWKYFFRRLGSVPPTIVIILFIIFVIFSTIGNPNPYSTKFPAYSNSVPSFLVAFATFSADVLTGKWGYLGAVPFSHEIQGPVNLLVMVYFFSTLEVLLIAAPIALLISFPLGRYIGTHQTRKTAKILKTMVAVGYLMPAYVVALLLQLFFGQGVIQGNPLGVFPISGAYDILVFLQSTSPTGWIHSGVIISSVPTHMLLIDSLLHGNLLIASDALLHLILPMITLIIGITAVVTFSLETGYVENMGLEYVRSARSRGVSERKIVIKHVRKNAVLPVLSSATIMVAYILSNVVMMEYVFAYPGIGYFLVQTMTEGQYYPTAVVIFLLGLIVVITGIAVDMINYAKNPISR